MNDVEDYCPANKQDWRKWLELNHNKKEAVWLIFYKKKSSKHNLNRSESVDEALCFGWIDSVKKTIDSEKFRQYFSKRKANSNWAKINKDKVAYLNSENLMQEAGNKMIEIAKNFDLIGGKLIAGDSTKLRAQNSKKKNYNKKKIARQLDYIESRLSHYNKQLAQADGDNKMVIQAQIDKHTKRKVNYNKMNKTLDESDEVQISTSDPVGLMFTAYSLKRIMNVINPKILKAYLKKLDLYSEGKWSSIKLFLSDMSSPFLRVNRYLLKYKTA